MNRRADFPILNTMLGKRRLVYLDNAATTHFMVILAYNIFLRTDIQSAQHPLEKSTVSNASIFHADVLHIRGCPHGFQLQLRHTIMHEAHGQRSYQTLPIPDIEIAGIAIISKLCGLHIHIGSPWLCGSCQDAGNFPQVCCLDRRRIAHRRPSIRGYEQCRCKQGGSSCHPE